MRWLLLVPILFCVQLCTAQTDSSYRSYLLKFRARYINSHEVVKGEDKQYLQFFPIDTAYVINARFERLPGEKWFRMSTSANGWEAYRRYGRLTFSIHDTLVTLSVYQSQALLTSPRYSNYLFIPFTDATSGFTSYGAGRYIDCTIQDIKNGTLRLDFNKAYNPYCAYTTGYNCPVPPSENNLPVAIEAGEKNYGKH